MNTARGLAVQPLTSMGRKRRNILNPNLYLSASLLNEPSLPEESDVRVELFYANMNFDLYQKQPFTDVDPRGKMTESVALRRPKHVPSPPEEHYSSTIVEPSQLSILAEYDVRVE